MHRTATGEKIKAMKAEAARSEREAATLAKVRGQEAEVVERVEEARRLNVEAEDLRPKARLEDLSVYTVAVSHFTQEVRCPPKKTNQGNERGPTGSLFL